jgi:PAS domain-containing protein
VVFDTFGSSHNKNAGLHNNDAGLMENQVTLVGKFDLMLKGTQTSSSNYLIKQLPRATAFFNKKFELVHVSDRWITDFALGERNVIGKTIYDLLEEISPEFEALLKLCLVGHEGESAPERHADGDHQDRWIKWTNIPWFDDTENIIGVIVQAEDVTRQTEERQQLKKLRLLLEDKSEIAKIGSWEYDARKKVLQWCPMTRKIHEVAENYLPDLDKAVAFYKEGYSRNTISMAIFKAMEKGTEWNEKLQLITAKGNELWVISAGRPIYKNGEFKGLIGTFQTMSDPKLKPGKASCCFALSWTTCLSMSISKTSILEKYWSTKLSANPLVIPMHPKYWAKPISTFWTRRLPKYRGMKTCLC